MSTHDLLGQIDLAFVIDTTGSMQPYIEEARAHARREAERIATSGDLDLRFAVVEYRDHPPQDTSFVTRVYPFGDGPAFEANLGVLVAHGGGDQPEAVWDGLVAAGHLDWRAQADHLCFLIGDAPPHGCGLPGVSLAEGGPCGLSPGGIVELFASKQIRLYAHSIAGIPQTTQAFKGVAEATGGSCTEVDRPHAATAAYSATLDSTSGLVTASRAYATAAAAMPAAPEAEVARSLGWSPTQVAGIKAYLARRGIKTDRTA